MLYYPLSHFQESPVLGLSFRTDGHPLLVSASGSGSVTVWDLEKRRAASVMKAAHQGKALCADADIKMGKESGVHSLRPGHKRLKPLVPSMAQNSAGCIFSL